MEPRSKTQRVILAVLFVAGLGLSTGAYAEEIKGVITARGNDGTLALLAEDSSSLTVVLDDATKIRRTDGLREMDVSSSALIPGLRVHVHGEYLTTNRFAARKVHYSRSDMKTAMAIKGGVDPTDRRSLENQKRIEQNARAIDQQHQMLQQQEREIAANKDQIRANNASIALANARITNLDDYNVVTSLTVYFANGKYSIPSKAKAELQQLASQAANVPSYMIQVQGYASAVGPDSLNQRLSFQRAEAVAAVLSQSGIPPTKMLTPATMGVSQQVASNKTAKGQAENRRVVVTVLQSKGQVKGSTQATPTGTSGSTVERK